MVDVVFGVFHVRGVFVPWFLANVAVAFGEDDDLMSGNLLFLDGLPMISSLTPLPEGLLQLR